MADPAKYLSDAMDMAYNAALGKHLDSVEEIKAVPIDGDDAVSRLDLIRELDRRIAFWMQRSDPNSAWFQGDVAKIATLRAIKEFVESMEAA